MAPGGLGRAETHLRTLVVASQKGGVGKTTLALNLSYAFAEAGFKTLLVDTDPQGAVGLSLSPSVARRAGLADVIAGEVGVDDAVLQTKHERLALMPVGRIAPKEVAAFSRAIVDGRRLEPVLDGLHDRYDVKIIDTPCGFGGITVEALRNSTHVVSPILAEPIVMRSVPQLFEMVQSLIEEGVATCIVGLVVTMLQAQEQYSSSVARELRTLFPPELLFDVDIPRQPIFLEATSLGVPVGLLRTPAPPVTHLINLIAAEIANRMQLFRKDDHVRHRTLVD